MGLKDDEEDESNIKKYIGRSVKKFFKGYGNFFGEVVSFNRARQFFKVKYADGDREELDLSELREILVDVETKSVEETPSLKGTGGRKRKRDQPVKYRNGVVENGGAIRCEEIVQNAGVATSKKQVFDTHSCENTQPVENTVMNGLGCEVPKVCGQVDPVESDHLQVQAVISASGVVHVDEKVDNCVDGRGKKRTVESAVPVAENARPTRLKKRARDASSSGFASRDRILPEQSGQPQLEPMVGAYRLASQEGKKVVEAGVDVRNNSFLGAIPLPDGPTQQISQADCNQSSAMTCQVADVATSPQQKLTSNGVEGMASARPSSGPLATAGTKGSSVPKVSVEMQVETVAKDVYSLRAIRAISRSLPVQRQIATSAADEESEATDREVVVPNEELELEVVSLKHPFPPSSTCLGDLEYCIANLFQAYSFLRSFSHALFLSPFALEEFVVALRSEVVSPMLDCIHVSLLQGLRRHLDRLAKNGNNSAIFCLRLSDWSLLDNITWPSYLMAYALTQGFLVGRGWSFQAGLVRKEYYKLPVNKKLAFLNFLCDKALETDEVRVEITRRVGLENDAELVDPKACTSKRPDRSCRDIISLEGEFDEEFERMTRQKRESVTQKTGMQGFAQGKSIQAVEVKQLERGEDGNLDECVLCGMDGVLICCDGCPAAYHSRCVGITKQGLPPGDWFCPECRADKLDSKGVRIPKGVRGGELLFVGPDGQRFFANCGYLLISGPSLDADSEYRYYSPNDIPKFLKYLEDAGPRYAALQAAVQRLCQLDLDSTLAANQTVAAAQTSGPTSLEEKIDPAVVAQSSGDPKVTTGVSLSSTHVVSNVTSIVPVGLEAPTVSTVEGTSHKESLASKGDGAASSVDVEQSVIPPVGPSTVLSKDEGKPDVLSETWTTEEASGGVLGEGAQQDSPQLKMDTCDQPLSTLEPAELGSSGNSISACNVFTEQKDEPVDLGKPVPMGQHMNGKCFPRQVDANFSSLTQINAGAYINKYTNGDIVFTAAAYLAAMAGNSDDTPDDKGGSQRKVKPPSAADQLKAFSQAAPTFFWPSLRKRHLEAPKEKCGWCINCRTPNRKGCLLTQVTGQISGGAAGVLGGIKPIKGAGGHYAAVAAYMFYLEEHLQGLLSGPWEVAGHRKLWRKRVEQGRSIEDVRRALLEMESSLRKVAVTPDWEKVVEDAPPLVSNYVVSLCGDGGPASKKVSLKRRGRPPTISKTPAVFAYDGACFGMKWWRGGQISRQVYNWESLPRKTLRKAARQGGLKEIRELVYAKTSELPRRTLQCAWRARTEKVSAVAQLAVQVRCLDRCIKWSEMKSPFEASSSYTGKASNDNKMTKAEILSKSEEKGVVKYLLHFPKDVAENSDSTHLQLDLSTKNISSNGNCASKKVSSAGIYGEGESEQWSLEKDVPLWLVKDFEQKRRKTEQMKSHKSVKGRKGQTSAVQKEPSFWDKITDPNGYKLQDLPSSWICGYCRLSCTKSNSLQCQRCTEKFHISCTEVEEAIDGREKVAVCKSCAKIRLGQRNRKPSYKIRSMQPHYAECSFVGSSKGTPLADADEVGFKSGSTLKCSSKKKDKGSFVAGHPSPQKEFFQPGKKKSGNRKNGLRLGSEHDPAFSEDKVFEKKGHIRQSADSNHLQANGSVKAGRSKSGRKLKSLQAVGRESRTSPDMIQLERRTSSRIKNSMSPGKCPLPVNQDQSLKVKLKLGRKEVTHTSPLSAKEDENRVSSKRKMALRKDSAPTEADITEDGFEIGQVEKKKSPQKRKRLKILLQGLPITSEDIDKNHVYLQTERKKASNGLQYVRRKIKSDEDVSRFRKERLVFAGHVGIDPATGPRCALCSEGYDPGYSFISCEWCEEWYHGDAVGLTQEDASILMGFKCHKCRKCRAPICPVSGTQHRRSAGKIRRRAGIDHGEVIDAENVNRSVQSSWRYPLEKDLIGFNDTKDFVAATNQAEQALAVDGSNFAHGLTGSVFELGSGLMCDLEQQLQLTTPLSSLGEHNVNLWASNSDSGQLDLPSDFSTPLDLSGRGTASLSFTELLASDDDYLEGVAGPGLPLGTAWVGDAAVSGSGVASGAAWCGGDRVAEGVTGTADWTGGTVSVGTTGLDPSGGWSGGESSARCPGIGPVVGWTGTESHAVSDGVAVWQAGEGSGAEMALRAGWAGRIDKLASILTPPGSNTDGSAAYTNVDVGSLPPSGPSGPQVHPGLNEVLRCKDKQM